MAPSEQPCRSVLYIPASNERALEKARGLPADGMIFDFEDAVAPDAKVDARHTLIAALGAGGYGGRLQLARVNALETEWGHDDLAALSDAPPPVVLLPKVRSAADIEALARKLDAQACFSETRIWAMMETAAGLFEAPRIAAAPRVGGFVMGTNDLAAELGCRHRPDRLALLMALQTCVAAARSADILCIDGVYNAFKDDDGLRAECNQGRDLGMDGKSLIHPAQIEVANACFAPSEAEVAEAEAHIAAWTEASARGQGVAVVDGMIVENLHVASARRVLARARAAAA